MSRHPLAHLVSPETLKAHRASWWCMAWDGQGNVEWLRHTAIMRGGWGHDVECSCGWKSRTGGGTRRSVEEKLWDHRLEAQWEAVQTDERGVVYVNPYQPVPDSFKDPVTCGTCRRTWDDSVPTAWTPAPSARCPFEYDHEEVGD